MFHITQPLDSIRYMVYNGYYKVMSNIPKMGHLTTPDIQRGYNGRGVVPPSQWIGFRENLQETIDFPIEYGAFL